MPAAERSFSDPPPDRLYVDTDIAISHLVSSQPHHARCMGFLENLARYGTVIYLSSLTWMEYVHVITRERFRQALPEETRSRFRLDRWEESRVREQFVVASVHALEELLNEFEWVEVFLTSDIRVDALRLVARYSLDGQDAIHLASALHEGVTDFAGFDAHYRRVDGIQLWNDRIHSGALS